MFYQNNSELIAAMMEKGYLKSPQLVSAFKANQRDFFVPLTEKKRAFWDIALPLFDNQTISQPSTVAIMLELLEVKPGQKVLDIGAGSGWVSCLLAHLVGSRGKVFAFEINPVVGKFGKEKVLQSGYENISYQIGNAAEKWHLFAPYDRIYAGAAFKKVPPELLKMLKINGALVVPLKSGYLEKITKESQNDFRKERYFGFAFVPFLETEKKKKIK